ncbi:MAG: ATP synthase F1 subunit delta [Solirubrobacterales bacterium]|nr:ATP synthase F1 subunit delta [Solirubrobacterales bacterium]MCB0863944.1 ATP synthase F1 subunit delta [Solirubrobacterales bacterium]MCB8914943.1 ATP synthase F1 subunit delta [Thermoleophilales bacterium]
MEELARVYAESLFGVAKEKGDLDEVQAQLAQFTDALEGNRELAVFFFSPYFSSKEKLDGLAKAVEAANPEFLNFLELLIEKHRMPAIFRIRKNFDDLWKKENDRIEVTVTSAIELDPSVAQEVAGAVEKQTGKKVDLTSRVDDSIIGGLVLQVGNMVLDSSIRNNLEKLRQSVAQAG